MWLMRLMWLIITSSGCNNFDNESVNVGDHLA